MTTAYHQPAPHRHHEFATALQKALSVSDVERTCLDWIGGLVPARAHALCRLEPGTCTCPAHTDYHHSIEVPLLVDDVERATLTFARGADDPPFDAEDLRGARRIGEQVGPALERALRYEHTRGRVALMETAFDHLPFAVVVTDLDANVLFCNRDATDTMAVDGADGTTVPPAREALEEAMSGFRRHNKRVSVTPVADPSGGTRVIVQSIRMGPCSDASVSVFYRDTRDSAAHLPVWTVLSPREQEIAELVSRGLTTTQIAERTFVTENTVKQHLKRIFAKAGVRNRAELLQRIWSLAERGDIRAEDD